jgi:DNA-binding Lrp family transcriptional regulator
MNRPTTTRLRLLLADKVEMSASACWRRVDSLEKSGGARYRAGSIANRRDLRCRPSYTSRWTGMMEPLSTQFVARVKQRTEGLECFATTGGADYLCAPKTSSECDAVMESPKLAG